MPKRTTKWDSTVTGLHSIETNGKSSWYLYYRLRDGRQRRSKLGSCSTISLGLAREMAKEVLAKVALGQDPFGERKRKHLSTVRDVFTELYLEHYTDTRFEKSGYQKEVFNLFTHHIEKPFGHRAIDKVTAVEVRAWHRALIKTPYVANRAKAVLSKIFNFAATLSLIPPGQNPCRAVPNFPEKSRKRYADEEEREKLWTVLTRYQFSRPREAAFIMLLMLTGSRPSALERARYGDVHEFEEGGVIRVDGKTGEDEIILSPKALEIIKALPPGQNDSALLGKFPRYFWQQVRDEAGVKGLWARDLRRTFGTVGLSSGISRGVISELLNHKSEQTTKIYSLLAPKAKLLAAKAIAEEMGK